MNKLRLLFQKLLSAVAIACGFNHRLVQFCDRCGRTHRIAMWWDETDEVWESVAGNVDGHHHGCFCLECFTILAREKGIPLIWIPTIQS